MNTFIKGADPVPKIIQGLAEKLAAEARRQSMESGYGAMTIRSVAEALGVSPGVVYNYYPSKENLAAAFILADWRESLAAMEPGPGDTPETALRAMHRELLAFLKLHGGIFRDARVSGFTSISAKYHTLLRAQLAAPIRRFCPDGFTAEFIAEAMLAWTIAGKSFEELSAPMLKLF